MLFRSAKDQKILFLGVQFYEFDKFILCTNPTINARNISNILESSLMPPLVANFLPSTLIASAVLLISVPRVLPFMECHRSGIIRQTAFEMGSLHLGQASEHNALRWMRVKSVHEEPYVHALSPVVLKTTLICTLLLSPFYR